MHRVTGGDPLLFETRENVLDAYRQLRDSHPAFPEVLRDFQVIKSTTNSTACTLLPLQADIVAAAINAEDGHHILSSLPTGMGKTLPMIVASCLLPPGELSLFSMKRNESCLSMPRRNLLSLQTIYQGSTTMIIVPLTTIKQQLEDDCTRLCHIVTKNNEYLAVLLCKYLLIATYILQILIFALLSVELCRFTNENNIEPIGTQHYQ